MFQILNPSRGRFPHFDKYFSKGLKTTNYIVIYFGEWENTQIPCCFLWPGNNMAEFIRNYKHIQHERILMICLASIGKKGGNFQPNVNLLGIQRLADGMRKIDTNISQDKWHRALLGLRYQELVIKWGFVAWNDEN